MAIDRLMAILGRLGQPVELSMRSIAYPLASGLIRRDHIAQIFGSIPVESAVDATRSQNITVS